MRYYKDAREHLAEMEARGKLVRINSPINKDTQLHPLVRLQFRGLPEEQRKAFIFTNICDSRGRHYDTPVVLCAWAGSSDIYALGLQCSVEEIADKLVQAQLHPIPPVMVERGPVQEEVHRGDNLLEHGGLDEFPVPISTPGYDPSPYFTASSWVTKDPETGVRNLGCYRAQVKSPTRTGVHFGDINRHGYIHWRKCKERGIPLEAAIVIGGPPSVGYASITKMPEGFDELTLAGGIAGEPLELVKCRTVDLEVPAYAEVVVEGELTTQELELEAPFGEAVGFVGMTEMMPYFTVKCITHRKNPVWVAFMSQFPPSESSKIRQHGNEAVVYKHLKHDLKLDSVITVAFHESSASFGYLVIQMRKPAQADVWKALEAAGERYPATKVIIAVDEDINPRDADAVNWAFSLRAQPHRDSRIVTHRTTNLLDPSLESHDDLVKRRQATYPEKAEASRLLVNATLKWPYPPVSLPKKPFMEEAIKIWQREGLPALRLKEPWYGYNLGFWTEEYDRWAEAAVKGEYYRTGENRARQNRTRI